jgi:hypothetical protein
MQEFLIRVFNTEHAASHFFGGMGGGLVGLPRAWFRSSSMNSLKKFDVLCGLAIVDVVSACLLLAEHLLLPVASPWCNGSFGFRP